MKSKFLQRSPFEAFRNIHHISFSVVKKLLTRGVGRLAQKAPRYLSARTRRSTRVRHGRPHTATRRPHPAAHDSCCHTDWQFINHCHTDWQSISHCHHNNHPSTGSRNERFPLRGQSLNLQREAGTHLRTTVTEDLLEMRC